MIDTDRIARRIQANKVIAIARALPEEKLIPIAEALYEGGIRLLECTFDHGRADCVEANCRMIASLVKHFEGRMDIGAGTVLTVEEVNAVVEAGGSFIISPNTGAEVIRATREAGAVSMPGALTPTEIVAAWNAGAHFVKIFPVSDMGPGYVRAVRAPLKHIPMLAVGGITPDNMADYARAGVCGFGVGGALFAKENVEKGDYAAICAQAKRYVAAAGGEVL